MLNRFGDMSASHLATSRVSRWKKRRSPANSVPRMSKRDPLERRAMPRLEVRGAAALAVIARHADVRHDVRGLSERCEVCAAAEPTALGPWRNRSVFRHPDLGEVGATLVKRLGDRARVVRVGAAPAVEQDEVGLSARQQRRQLANPGHTFESHGASRASLGRPSHDAVREAPRCAARRRCGPSERLRAVIRSAAWLAPLGSPARACRAGERRRALSTRPGVAAEPDPGQGVRRRPRARVGAPGWSRSYAGAAPCAP